VEESIALGTEHIEKLLAESIYVARCMHQSIRSGRRRKEKEADVDQTCENGKKRIGTCVVRVAMNSEGL
jgi:hypothetical protein